MYGANTYSSRRRPVDPVDTSMDEEYDYQAATGSTPTPTTASARGLAQNRSYQQQSQQQYQDDEQIIDPDAEDYAEEPQDDGAADEALQDLAELEELQNEAERMKAVGNKHMAAQEYIQAYNAYSAALQLSPVGPSSHVFLSNRAAALLSLKRYPAAATDARRAVALAPTFGKAHARLGQALYFLKDYQAAVHAYQDAIEYEPDNAVTQTYLDKAMTKLEKQQQRSSGVSVMTDNTGLTTPTNMGAMSVATDPDHQQGIMQNRQYSGANTLSRAAMLHATAKQTPQPPQLQHPDDSGDDLKHPQEDQQPLDDPEFDEAVRIQQRANAYLVHKQYRQAIEEYTAALFLVPDDDQLSPDLHLGRAHALNGSRRHESAKNDAVLALRLQESAAAYSTLAKSLFYLKDYQGAVDAFAKCQKQLPEGERLGMFDQAYLEKAEKALGDEAASLAQAGRIGRGAAASSPMNNSTGSGGVNTSSNRSVVPKLPPPRFVPREEAVHSTTPVRRMPKEWPQQSPSSRQPLNCGPERDVVCLSEGLGIKLNRGSDGRVRVLSVTDPAEAPDLLRQGVIRVGDVIREAAGVDIRRPITNIMWGDTVALIKMAPRPITLTVAEELSPVPPQVLDEQRKARVRHDEPPSRASDDGAVAVVAAEQEEEDDDIVEVDDDEVVDGGTPPSDNKLGHNQTLDTVAEQTDEDKTLASSPSSDEDKTQDEEAAAGEDDDIESVEDENSSTDTPVRTKTKGSPSPIKSPDDEDYLFEMKKRTSLRDEEEKVVGGEILFLRDSPPSYGGWDTLRWMAHNGARKVNFCQPVFRLSTASSKRKGLPLFWKQGGKHYEERSLIVYDEPNLILIVRRPKSLQEIQQLLGLPDAVATVEDPAAGSDSNWELNPETALTSYWVLESVADPASSKLRLSPVTTATSVATEFADDRERSCFQILTPTETIVLSAVHVRTDTKKREQSFSDSGAFLETLSVEASIAQAICDAHSHSADLGATDRDIAWKHQVIVGSLHSLVLSGNPKFLEEGIQQARETTASRGDNADATFDPNYLPARIVDAIDDNGFPALYYACTHKMDGAVQRLVNAGADVTFKTEVNELSMLHIAARNLDDKTLSTLLSATFPSRPDPNVLDKKGRTPMYVALVEGSAVNNKKDPAALGRCISALEAWGGKMLTPDSPTSMRNPISALAYMNLPDFLSVALDHVPYRFPLPSTVDTCMSLGALYQYPVHSALAALRKKVRKSTKNGNLTADFSLVQTLRVLFEYGFEPNERLDQAAFGAEKTAFDEYVGFAPLQILALVALELDAAKEDFDAAVVDSSFKLVADIAEFLVKSGARLSLDPPPTARLRHSASDAVPTDSPASRQIEILSQKLDADKPILVLLGGEERLNSAHKEWTEMKKVATTTTRDLLEDDKADIVDSPSAGGSDSRSCAVCWSEFGTLMNRKHKCRVMRKYVCDDCSSKRLIQVTSEYRLTDGQFNLARVDALKEQNERVSAVKEKERSKAESSEKARAAARLDRLEAEEKSNRDSLFGGMLDAATNFVMGDEEETKSQQVNGLTASLDQTRNALNQRGEKLDALNDKSAKLVETSADFAKMAKELRKQSEGGLFW